MEEGAQKDKVRESLL